MRGAAPGIDLLVFRTIAQAGGDKQASILREHVERAVASGADILCLSLGFGDIGYARRLPEDPPGERRSLGDAIEDALDQGVLVVAAAGTAHPDVTDVEFPAKIPGVIAVGAVDEHGRPAAFSPAANVTRNVAAPEPENRTNRWPPDLKPEIAAPGSGMLAPTLDGAWGKLSGTSAATPIVCGGLALLLEAHPELRRERDRDTVTGIKNALAATAQPVSGQVMPHDPVVGHGLFRADRLVDAYA
jgi:subtilisin family serine protease